MDAEPSRFFLDQDNSCHWYLIDAARRQEWDAWRDLDEDDERAWEAPDYVMLLAGGPSDVEFSDPNQLQL